MSNGVPTDGVIFVNRFTLSGSPEEFEAAFAETAAFLKEQPGLIEFSLLQSSEKPDQYLNVARWADAGALHTAVRHPYFAKHAEALRAVSKSEPHLYAPRQIFVKA